MSRAADDVAMLLDAARAELGPSAADAERVKARVLAATVGAAAGAAVAAAATTGGAGAGAGAAGAGAAGGAAAGAGVAGAVGGGTLALKLGALALALGGVVGGAVYVAKTRTATEAPAARPSFDSALAGARATLGTNGEGGDPAAAASMPEQLTVAPSGAVTGPVPGSVTGSRSGPGSVADSRSGSGSATTRARGSHARAAAPAVTSVAGAPDTSDSAASAPPPAAAPPAPAAPAAPAADDLARENELLRRAVAALAQGQPAAAITAIDLHRREFPDGQLAHDVAALRIQAQCRLGQHDLAARARAALLARWPSSAHLATIDRVCGGTRP